MSLGYCFFNSYVFVSAVPPVPYVYQPFTGAVVGTGGTQDRAWDIAIDSQNFIYVCGLYNASANIYDRTGTVLGTLPAVTGDAAFACKFSNAGALQYSLVVDSAGTDIGQFLTIENSNVYLTGYYAGTPNIIFRSSANASTTLGTLPASTGNSAFACKFSNTGSLVYSLLVESAGSDIGYGSTVDSLNNFYLGGNYTGTPNIIFRSSANVSTTLGTLPASSGSAAFTTKFSSTGTLQHSFVVDSTTNNDTAWTVACDAFSNIYFGGQYNGTPNIIFRSSANVSTTLGTLPATLGTDVAFATKCSDTGVLQYSLLVDSTGSDVGYKLACDSFSNVYMVGQYNGTPNIIFRSSANVSTTLGTLPASSGLDGFACKFDSVGTLRYSYTMSSSQGDGFWSVSCDPSSNVLMSGYYRSPASLRRTSPSNVTTLVDRFQTTVTLDSGFVSKFDSDGNYLFSIISDSSANDGNYATEFDSIGNIYFGGQNQNGVLRDASTGQFLNYSILTPTQTAVNSALPIIPARLGAYYIKTDPTGSTGIPQLGYYPNFSRIVNASTSSQVNGLVCDLGSNLYASYSYTGTTPVIIDQNSTTHGSLPTSSAQAGALTKFDSVGTVLFSRIIDSTGAESGTCVTIDSQSNVYLGSVVAGAATVRDQAGTSLGTIPAPASSSATLSKFSSTTGSYQYSLVIDSSQADQTLGTTCDIGSNVYLCGYYGAATATIRYINTTGTSTSLGTLPAVSFAAGVASKFTSNGTLLYTLLVNTTSGLTQQALGCTCDVSGNFYMSGLTISTANIGYVSNSNVLTTLGTIPSPSNYAAYTVKFSVTGSLLYSVYVDSVTAGNSDWAYSPACDSNLNLYVSGFYGAAAGGTANIRFTTSSNVTTTVGTLPSASGQAAFISKFSSTGTYLYSYVLDASGASNLEASYNTACDLYGNVYFVGEYLGTPTLQYVSNANVATTVTSLPASSGAAGFMISISPTGLFNYARIVDVTTNADRGYAVTCDPSNGNVFFGGQYNGAASIKDQFNTTLATLPTLTNRGFICKFIGNSTTLAAQNLAGPISYLYYTSAPSMGNNTERTVAVDTDVSGNVFIISQRSTAAPVLTSKNAVTMKTMPTTSNIATSLIKFTNKGRYEWDIYSTNFGNAGVVENVLCSVTTENSNIYIGSQQIASTVVTFFNTSNVAVSAIPASSTVDTCDTYIAKFDTLGTFQWKSYVQGAQNSFASVSASSGDNAVFLAGTKNGTAQMNVFSTSNTSVANIPLSSVTGTFLVKYDRDGTYQWRTYMDGAILVNRGVATDSKSNVYVSGYFTGYTEANVYASTGSTPVATITKTGTNDAVYLVKYLTDGSFSWYAFMNITTTNIAQQFGSGCDTKSNVYVCGFTTATNMDVFDRTNYSVARTTITGPSGVLVKFSEDGYYQWYARVYSPTNVSFNKVCTDVDFDAGSNVYATFSLLTPAVGANSTVTVQDGQGTLTTVTVGVINASYSIVVKFLENGKFQWVTRQTPILQGRHNPGVAVFGSNVYTSGVKTTGTLTVLDRNATTTATIPATGSTAAYVAQYFTDGTYAFNDFQVTNFSV